MHHNDTGIIGARELARITGRRAKAPVSFRWSTRNAPQRYRYYWGSRAGMDRRPAGKRPVSFRWSTRNAPQRYRYYWGSLARIAGRRAKAPVSFRWSARNAPQRYRYYWGSLARIAGRRAKAPVSFRWSARNAPQRYRYYWGTRARIAGHAVLRTRNSMNLLLINGGSLLHVSQCALHKNADRRRRALLDGAA